jgi:DNA primase
MAEGQLKEIFNGLDAYVVLQDILGVGEIQESGDELIHSCHLNIGNHKNGDRSPSASLNKDTLLFNCFTCGGGSVIWLVQNSLNITREEAIARLLGESNGSAIVSIEDFIKRLEGVFDTNHHERVEIPVYSDTLLKRWEGPCEYLTSRGVSEAVQREMRTGVEENRSEFSKSPEGERLVTLDRVVIPHFMKGKLVGWVARKIQDVPGVPKYRNSKGFPRGSWLFNLDNVDMQSDVYVVESPMSVLVMKSRGVRNVVATFGAKVDKQQIDLLRNFSKITIFMDGDDPGRNATAHLIESLGAYTKLSIIETPDDEDPATMVYVPNSISSFEYQLKHCLTYSS